MPEMSSWIFFHPEVIGHPAAEGERFVAECRSGMSRATTRSAPIARTESASVTLLSIPPETATTSPRRLRDLDRI